MPFLTDSFESFGFTVLLFQGNNLQNCQHPLRRIFWHVGSPPSAQVPLVRKRRSDHLKFRPLPDVRNDPLQRLPEALHAFLLEGLVLWAQAIEALPDAADKIENRASH